MTGLALDTGKYSQNFASLLYTHVDRSFFSLFSKHAFYAKFLSMLINMLKQPYRCVEGHKVWRELFDVTA